MANSTAVEGIEFTESELITALQDALTANDDGATVHELAVALGMSVALVRRRLRALHLAGRLRVGQRSSTRIDGRACKVPVYQLK